jgi:hypothetical protein
LVRSRCHLAMSLPSLLVRSVSACARWRSPDAYLHAPKQADVLLMELWDLREECLTNSWYGIAMTILSSGECKTVFTFDTECITDKNFFDY